MFSQLRLGSLAVFLGLGVGCSYTAEAPVERRDNPQQGYQIAFDLRELPDPNAAKNVRAEVMFSTADSGQTCIDNPFPELYQRRMPSQTVAIPLSQTEPGIFEGTVYLDWLKDENYFGDGLCMWQMGTINANFNGPGGMDFNIGMDPKALLDGSAEAYYWTTDFSENSSLLPSPVAMAVPTNDYRNNPNSVKDRNRFFPVRLQAEPLSPQVLPPEKEFQQRRPQ